MRKYVRQFTLTKEGKLPRGEALWCPRYGIYAFVFNGEVIRFGESKSGFERIKKEFNHQLRRKNKKKNYHAYHFREKYSGKCIQIRYYASSTSSLKSDKSRRAIEAELTYHYRVAKGKWPVDMIEIHFSNNLSKNQVRLMREILSEFGI